ncbi:MAG TPA: site-specific DNA-methyltransferase [Solirubrobacteraceae bacterium]|nr:site-specific DNA-methyltransferase [Solirubrobacteraceae bacterium]
MGQAPPRTRRRWQLKHADCLHALPQLAPASIDAVITDPPYGVNANHMRWDRPATLDPTRTPGRRRRAGTDADPAGAFQRFSARWSSECLRALKPGAYLAAFAAPRTFHLLACGLEQAGFELRDTLMWLQGQGYPATQILPDGLGTGLKPAWEPILLARRPPDGPIEQNLARYRTGAMRIDACRIKLAPQDCPSQGRAHGRCITASPKGRWPANLLLSHGHSCTPSRCEHDCPVALLGERARFFYAGKASRRERDAGCEQLARAVVQTYKIGAKNVKKARERPVANIHPTVKPIELMRWLVRLLTPPGGLVLDPFTGSGSTGAAAVLEGARFIGIEREAAYVPIARARITHWARVERVGRAPRRVARGTA